MAERELARVLARKAAQAGSPASAMGRAPWAARALAGRIHAARPALLSLLAGALAWEAVGQAWDISFLPPFSRVLAAAVEMTLSGQIVGNLALSLAGLAAGYALAVAAGVSVGALMGRYRKVEHALDPFLTGLLAAPKLVFVPVLYVFFGVGRGTQVAVVFLSAVFVIMLNTMNAIRTVDNSYVEMARSFGAQGRQLFWKVLLPGALPLTLAGLRIGIGRAVRGMINGEMYIALFGLGALLRRYGGQFNAEKVFAILLVVVLVALACSALFRAFERRLTHWAEPAA
jgi:NitT/TauT family transport system permease protein